MCTSLDDGTLDLNLQKDATVRGHPLGVWTFQRVRFVFLKKIRWLFFK